MSLWALYYNSIFPLLTICKNWSKLEFKKSLQFCLKNSFLETLKEIRSSYSHDKGKFSTYFKLKFSFVRENYLSFSNPDDWKILTKLRLSNHKIRIETSRHELKFNSSGKLEYIPRCERLCNYCNLNVIEDELYFV